MPDAGRFSGAGEQRERAVSEAAAVPERDSAAAPAHAEAAGERLVDGHRVDQEEFGRLVRRVSDNTHELIDAVSARVLGTTAGDAAEHTRKIAESAHDIVDLLLNLSRLAPALADQGLGTASGPQRTATGVPEERPGG
ncbi:hypothetical protein AB0C76_28915 [Kitasatospora sp. NPDC048722]|uniref:hypothetical protein n=1 Tax=Kitasatospora sp. NPDC048722 TaxID=3155639 RepID=UPI0033D45D2A